MACLVVAHASASDTLGLVLQANDLFQSIIVLVLINIHFDLAISMAGPPHPA